MIAQISNEGLKGHELFLVLLSVLVIVLTCRSFLDTYLKKKESGEKINKYEYTFYFGMILVGLFTLVYGYNLDEYTRALIGEPQF